MDCLPISIRGPQPPSCCVPLQSAQSPELQNVTAADAAAKAQRSDIRHVNLAICHMPRVIHAGHGRLRQQPTKRYETATPLPNKLPRVIVPRVSHACHVPLTSATDGSTSSSTPASCGCWHASRSPSTLPTPPSLPALSCCFASAAASSLACTTVQLAGEPPARPRCLRRAAAVVRRRAERSRAAAGEGSATGISMPKRLEGPEALAEALKPCGGWEVVGVLMLMLVLVVVLVLVLVVWV